MREQSNSKQHYHRHFKTEEATRVVKKNEVTGADVSFTTIKSWQGNTHVADAFEKKMFVSLPNFWRRGSFSWSPWIDLTKKCPIPFSDVHLPCLKKWVVRHTWQTPMHAFDNLVLAWVKAIKADGTTESALFSTKCAGGNMSHGSAKAELVHDIRPE